MAIQFGSFIDKFSLNGFVVTTPAGGTITSPKTGYLWFQGLNRAGRNKLSDPFDVAISAGQILRITIPTDDNFATVGTCPPTPSTIDKALDNLYFLLISWSETNDPTTARQLGIYSFRTADQLTFKSFPVVIDFDKETDFDFSDVPTLSALPDSPHEGQLKKTIDTCFYYVYQPEALSGDKAVTGGGYWVKTPFNGYTYISSLFGAGGTNRPTSLIKTYYAPPPKPANTDSIPMIFWLTNGATADGQPSLPQGYNLGVKVTVNGTSTTADGIPVGTVFNGLVIYKLEGYIDLATGIIDTNIPTAGTEYPWNAATTFSLPIPLPRGYAASYSLKLRFRDSDLRDIIPVNSSVGITLQAFGLISSPSALSGVIGDCVFNDLDNLRIVPGKRLSGQAIGKGFITARLGEEEHYGYGTDTNEQIAALNVAFQGNITIRPTVNDLLPTEIVRAKISTLPGEGGGYVSDPIAVTLNDELNITVHHPVTGELWTVRDDFDDRIAGTPGATIYPVYMRVYLTKDGTTTYLAETQTVVINSATQLVSVSSVSVVASPPVDTTSFGLYRPTDVTLTTTGGTGLLAAGSYVVTVVYYYPTPNTVPTAITHKEIDGCVTEIQSALTAVLQAALTTDDVVEGGTNQYYTNARVQSYISTLLLGHTIQEASVDKPQRAKLNFLTGATIADNPGDNSTDITISGGGGDASTLQGQNGAYYLARANHTGTQLSSTISDLSNQNTRVAVDIDAVAIGTRRKINFIEGTNVTLSATDNSGAERIDLTISATGGGGGDASTLQGQNGAYYLARANHTGTQLSSTISDLSNQNTRVAVEVDAVVIGTRRKINFIEGSNVTLSATDNGGSEKVDLTISATNDGGNAATLQSQNGAYYLARANHTGTQLSSTISDLADQNTRVAVDIDAVAIGTRRKINFIEGSNVTLSATDNNGTESIDLTISATGGGGGAGGGNGLFVLTGVKTANYTAKNADKIPCDTSGGSFTITTPNSGKFQIIDVIGNTSATGFGVNNLTVTPATGTIMGAASFVADVGSISLIFELIGTDWRLVDGGGITYGLTNTKTANYTAERFERIPCDTSGGSFTITTPDSGGFQVIDIVGNTSVTGFAVNNLTITPASGTIMGASSFVLDVGAISPTFELIGTDWRLT